HKQGFRSTAQRLGLERAPTHLPAPEGEPAMPEPLAAVPPPPAATAAFGPYEGVTELSALQEWIERAREAGVVALNVETDRLDPLACDLLGISLAIAPGQACYVPLQHVDDFDQPLPNQVPPEQAIAALAPLLADGSVLKIFQNAKFNLLALGC